MRDHRRLEAFHLLDQMACEIYETAHGMSPDDRGTIGRQMQVTVGRGISALIQGCSSRNSSTFIPFLEVAHGATAELGYQLRHCRRLRILTEAHADFLLQRQHSASQQVLRLLQRSMMRELDSLGDFEWEDAVDGVESPTVLLNAPPPPKRPRGRPPKSSNGSGKMPEDAEVDAADEVESDA